MTAKIAIILIPSPVHQLMIALELTKTIVPKISMNPIPIILTWVGKSSLIYTMKKLNSTVIANSKMNTNIRTIIFELTSVTSFWSCSQIKVSAIALPKIIMKHMQAMTLLFNFLITKKVMIPAKSWEDCTTKPLMKMSKLN